MAPTKKIIEFGLVDQRLIKVEGKSPYVKRLRKTFKGPNLGQIYRQAEAYRDAHLVTQEPHLSWRVMGPVDPWFARLKWQLAGETRIFYWWLGGAALIAATLIGGIGAIAIHFIHKNW